eukprot:3613977-Pleurochrysis_carterae.AAC.1
MRPPSQDWWLRNTPYPEAENRLSAASATASAASAPSHAPPFLSSSQPRCVSSPLLFAFFCASSTLPAA